MINYFNGVLWFILSLIISALNDVISKYIGTRLVSFEVTFFRFLFGTVILIPIIYMKGINSLKTNRIIIHLLRGLLLFCGIALWIDGLTMVRVTVATLISFTIPSFVLLLSIIFLREKIIWQRWFAVIIGFFGIIVTINPNEKNFGVSSIVFVLASISFAALDVINKNFVTKESMLSMIFYSNIITTMIAFFFSISYWIKPTIFELFLLLLLGVNANIILFSLLKSFSYVAITALAPYRYLELIISSLMSYLAFGATFDKSNLCGALIIIPSTLFLYYSENKVLTQNIKSRYIKWIKGNWC